MSEPARSCSDMPSSTAQTPSVIGSSTPMRRDRSRSTGAVVSPSTTWPICALASSGAGAARDQLPRAAVASQGVEARHDQIAHPGQPRERLRLRAAGLSEPRHLDEAAGDQRRLRVVAQPEPVHRAGGQCDHVLRRPAELDADQVAVHVDTERPRVDRLLQPQCERLVLRRDHRGTRQAGRHLLRHRRAGEHRDGAAVHERRQPVAGRRIEAFDEAQDRHIAAHMREHLAEGEARDGDHDEIGFLVRRVVERRTCGDEDVVVAVSQQAAERPPPRPTADDHDPHGRSRKSTTTGTPSRLKRSRS